MHEHHRRAAGRRLKLAVITASDTRAAVDDKSGQLIRELLEAANHHVGRYEIVPDEPERIAGAVRAALDECDGAIVNGGTGVAPRDQTIEAIRPLLEKEIEGFGELFRMLSYQEIGPAAMLSRAIAGIAGGRIVVALPGSTAGCRLAMEKLLLPELGHIGHLLGLGA